MLKFIEYLQVVIIISNMIYDMIIKMYFRLICQAFSPQTRQQLENKGIVFKARWFVRPDINRGATISGMTTAFPRKNNGHVRVYIEPYKPSRFKNNTFIIILKHFQKITNLLLW